MASLAPIFRANATTPRCKTFLVSLIGLLRAGDLLAAHWWFGIRYVRPFSKQTTLLFGDSLCLPAEPVRPGPIRLMYFWDSACSCNVGNQQYLGKLIERSAGKDMELHVPQKPGSQGRPPDNLTALHPLAGLPGFEQLSANPVAVIWDRDSRLTYFSSYSEDAICTPGNGFIEPVLEALLQGCLVDAIYILAANCYCPWLPEKG